jgi:hypothetical protein
MSSAAGHRRRVTATMSCSAAPSGLVTTATRRGKRGSGRRRAGSSRPSAASAARVRSSAFRHSRRPARRAPSDELQVGARGVHAHLPELDHPASRRRAAREGGARAGAKHAPHLRVRVAQREVPVPRCGAP